MNESFDDSQRMPTVERLKKDLRARLGEASNFLSAKKPSTVFQEEILNELSKNIVGISEVLDNVSVSIEDNELRSPEIRLLRENLDTPNTTLRNARAAFET